MEIKQEFNQGNPKGGNTLFYYNNIKELISARYVFYDEDLSAIVIDCGLWLDLKGNDSAVKSVMDAAIEHYSDVCLKSDEEGLVVYVVQFIDTGIVIHDEELKKEGFEKHRVAVDIMSKGHFKDGTISDISVDESQLCEEYKRDHRGGKIIIQF